MGCAGLTICIIRDLGGALKILIRVHLTDGPGAGLGALSSTKYAAIISIHSSGWRRAWWCVWVRINAKSVEAQRDRALSFKKEKKHNAVGSSLEDMKM